MPRTMDRRWTRFFCEKIKEAIGSERGAQKAFAQKTREIYGARNGYSESYISQICTKQVSGLPVDTVIDLCEALGLDFAQLYKEQRAKEALRRSPLIAMTPYEVREQSQMVRARSRALHDAYTRLQIVLAARELGNTVPGPAPVLSPLRAMRPALA